MNIKKHAHAYVKSLSSPSLFYNTHLQVANGCGHWRQRTEEEWYANSYPVRSRWWVFRIDLNRCRRGSLKKIYRRSRRGGLEEVSKREEGRGFKATLFII
jgi:hypothetical protein